MIYPRPVLRLIEELARLPGIGPKGAQRLAFHVLRTDAGLSRRLADALVEARTQVHPCAECGFFAEAGGPCVVCKDPRRDRTVVAVVEDPKDVAALEATHEYRGLYHVLGGALSPMDGVGPAELRIAALVRRLASREIREVVLATDPDVEGEATASYLGTVLRPLGVRVTRIARGLPMGGDLDYADALTLIRALEGRRDVDEEAPPAVADPGSGAARV